MAKEITIDLKKFGIKNIQLLSNLDVSLMRKSIGKALNKTAKELKEYSTNLMKPAFKMDQGASFINKNIKTKKTRLSKPLWEQSVDVNFTRRTSPLDRYHLFESESGISSSAPKEYLRPEIAKSAFIGKIRSNPRVLVRTSPLIKDKPSKRVYKTNAQGRRYKSELPVTKLTVTSTNQQATKYILSIENKGNYFMQKNVVSALDKAIEKSLLK